MLKRLLLICLLVLSSCAPAFPSNPGGRDIGVRSVSGSPRVIPARVYVLENRQCQGTVCGQIDYNQPYPALFNGLAGYWRLDETTGTRYDASPNANNLTSSGTGATTGKVNGAASFTAANSNYLSVTNNVSLAYSGSFSVGGWVYLTVKSANKGIMSKDDGGTQREWHLLYVSSTDRFTFRLFDTGGTNIAVTADAFGSPALNTWYWINAGYDSVNQLIFISINNGTLNSISSAGYVPAAKTSPFSIGVQQTGLSYMDGWIDEVFFYKRLKTASENAALYNGGAGLPTVGALPVVPQNGIPAGAQATWQWSEIETSSGVYNWTAFDSWAQSGISNVVSLKLTAYDPIAGIVNYLPSYLNANLVLPSPAPGCPSVRIPDLTNAALDARYQAFLTALGAHLDATPASDKNVAAILIHTGTDWSSQPAGVATIAAFGSSLVCDYSGTRRKYLSDAAYLADWTAMLNTTTLSNLGGATHRAVYLVLGDGDLATRRGLGEIARANAPGVGVLMSINSDPPDAYLTGAGEPYGSLQAADVFGRALAYAVKWSPDSGSATDAYFTCQAMNARYPDFAIVAPAWLQQIDASGCWPEIDDSLGYSLAQSGSKQLKWTTHTSEQPTLSGQRGAPSDDSKGIYLTSVFTDSAGLPLQAYNRQPSQAGCVSVISCTAGYDYSPIWQAMTPITAQIQIPLYGASARVSDSGHSAFYFRIAPTWWSIYPTRAPVCASGPAAYAYEVTYLDNGVAVQILSEAAAGVSQDAGTFAAPGIPTNVYVTKTSSTNGSCTYINNGIVSPAADALGNTPVLNASFIVRATNGIALFLHSFKIKAVS